MENIRGSEWLLFMALLIHLIMAPFTKVEESFNIQAVHDMLRYRSNLSQYDHNEFPGVVPRTFVGALIIASSLTPLLPIFHFMELQKYWLLFIARFVLGSLVVIALCNFARCVEKRFGESAGQFLRLITASQFHFLFYASRTLPNTFALIFVLWAYQKLLDRELIATTVLATFATVLLRFELMLLFGPIFLVVFVRGLISPIKAVFTGILTATITLAISIPFDSLMWGRWVWPEGEVLWFNTILNRSEQYGVSPFWWYFTSALPRALSTTLPLVPLGCLLAERRALVSIVGPAVSFIVIYSFLPHKELRFIIYAFPLLNMSAAVFCSKLWDSRNVSAFRRVFAYATALHLLANMIISSVFLYASTRNYPGGDAISYLQYIHRFRRNDPLSVHIDVFCAETGVNRFLHLYENWEYNKTEGLSVKELQRFDYVLLGDHSSSRLYEIVERNFSKTHKKDFAVEAFYRIQFRSVNTFPFYQPVVRFKEKVISLYKSDN